MITLGLMAVVPLLMLPAQAPSAALAAVVVTSPHGASEQMLDGVSSALARRLQKSGRYARVMSDAEVLLSLDVDLKRDVVRCKDVACVCAVARPIGIDQMLVGLLVKVEGGWGVQARLVDTRAAKVLASADVLLPGERMDQWDDELDVVTARLLGVKAAARTENVVAPVKTEPVGAGAPAAASSVTTTPASEEPKGGGVLLTVMRMVSALGLGIVGLGVVGAVLGAVLAGAVYLVFTRVPGFDAQRSIMEALVVGGMAMMAGAFVVVILGALLGAGAGLAASMGA